MSSASIAAAVMALLGNLERPEGLNLVLTAFLLLMSRLVDTQAEHGRPALPTALAQTIA